MKKIVAALLILILLAVAALFFYLPATQQLEEQVRLRVNQKALHRTLLEQSLSVGKTAAEEKAYQQAVQLHPGMYDGFVLRINKEGLSHNGLLKLVPLSQDSTLVYWSAVLQGGSSPWQRIETWQKSRRLSGMVRNFLSDLRRYEDQAAVYGLKINFSKVRDSVMVATRFKTAHYPTTADIYQHIDLLQQYISRQGAEATNSPMLFVQPTGSGYEAQVAVPTSRLLPGAGTIAYRRMVMGNILEAEVTGGQMKVEQGIRNLEHFVNDQDLISPAIPFALLVTDRRQEPDSSRWLTRIYMPIY